MKDMENLIAYLDKIRKEYEIKHNSYDEVTITLNRHNEEIVEVIDKIKDYLFRQSIYDTFG